MKHYTDIVFNTGGLPASGISVTVKLAGSNTSASLFSDNGITPISNPVVTSGLGRYDFYVADGRYDLAFSGSGITPLTLSDVEIFDLIERNTGDTNPAFNGIVSSNTSTTTNGTVSVTNTANFTPNYFTTVGTTNPLVPGPNGAACGLIGEATSLTNGSVTSGIVGVYGGAKRSQGIGGTWGGNVLAETNIAVSASNPCYGFEVDINNNWRDAVSTDLINGLTVLNGATFKSNIGLLIGKGAGSSEGFVQGIAVTSADAGISIQATDNSLDVQPQSSASSVTGYSARRLQSATSGGNYPFPQMVFNSAVWNGSASVDSAWSFSHAINASGTPTFDSFRIANSASPTTNLAVEIPNRLIIDTNGGGSSIISSTTPTANVVFALPNTAASGNVVVDNAAQTLTNKTIATQVNGLVTAGQSVSLVVGATSQKSETAADTNVLTYTPAATAGSYRIRFTLSLSAANAATVGWTATWKNSNDTAQAPTNLALYQVGTAAPALTFTTSVAGDYYADLQLDTDNSATAVVVKLTFSGTSFAGKVSATVERVI